MGRKKLNYKKNKETFFQKCINFVLTILLAALIAPQVCTAANNNLRFVQVSDVHYSSFEKNTSYKLLEKSEELIDDAVFQINTSGPYDFVIFTGDLINTPRQDELDKVLSHINKLNYAWYAIDGNHDISIDGYVTKKSFINTLNSVSKKMNADNIYYAFTPKKGFRVLCMDSIIDYKITTQGEYSASQIEWLKKELDEHKKDVIVICTHVPIKEPFSSPNHKLKNDYEVRRILKSYKNPIIVLQGHYHCARAVQDDNIIYVSTPSLVTYPNAFRVINIHVGNNNVSVNIVHKETGLKEVLQRAKLRVLGSEVLSGTADDQNITFDIVKNKE